MHEMPRIGLEEGNLREKLMLHFRDLGFVEASDGSLALPGITKDHIRDLHGPQRSERVLSSQPFLATAIKKTLSSFANASEIDPKKIRLSLRRVVSGSKEAALFRVASLTWSVPVSPGFGRRMRYLVWDDHHDRLVGIFALGDPVFNLAVRDNLIGWSGEDRSGRLVNILDAYVLGAVPPYNYLLGGKAVACLIRSQEVYDDFEKAYGATVGIISHNAKGARLLAVSTSSSMGRSSIYNRIKLEGTPYFQSIGFTTGWGHFHINDALFSDMRAYLRLMQHRYADEHTFGRGPNWRLRTIRAALNALGLKSGMLKHGIKREVFLCDFASNTREILKAGNGTPDLAALKTCDEISTLVRERWMVPRSRWLNEQADHPFHSWERKGIIHLINNARTESDVPALKRLA